MHQGWHPWSKNSVKSMGPVTSGNTTQSSTLLLSLRCGDGVFSTAGPPAGWQLTTTLLVCVRSRRALSRQRDESAEMGKSRIFTRTHGLDSKKNSLPPPVEGEVFFLTSPSQKLTLPLGPL